MLVKQGYHNQLYFLQKIFRELDTNDDLSISRQEFLAAMEKMPDRDIKYSIYYIHICMNIANKMLSFVLKQKAWSLISPLIGCTYEIRLHTIRKFRCWVNNYQLPIIEKFLSS